ncbi:hypothetical protein Tco_1035718 [Tanacetum coccineum]
MAPNLRSGPSNNENPDIAAIIAQQLQNIIPQIVTQVTNNVNNANGGNGGNNGCSYKAFLACNPRDYNGKGGAVALTRCIEKMESAIGHEAAIGITWVEFKALLVEEFCPSNEMEKLESEFWNHTMVGANHAGYTDRFHDLAKLVPHLSAILKVVILIDEEVRCGTLTRSSEKRKEVEETSNKEVQGKIIRRQKWEKGAENIKRIGHDIVQDSIWEQDDDSKEDQEEDGDDEDTFDMWDITVEDVERIRKFFNVPDEIDEIVQPLIPEPIHTTPPNDDYVAPATKSILDELLEEFRDEILNVTMVDEIPLRI